MLDRKLATNTQAEGRPLIKLPRVSFWLAVGRMSPFLLDWVLLGDDDDEEEGEEDPDLLPHFLEYIECRFSLIDKLSSKAGIESALSLIVDSLDSVEWFELLKLI